MARSSRPRLADLAVRAGVSTATASRVMSGRPGVSEATREAVLRAVGELGYDRPRPAPSGDDERRAIAIVTPELSNPAFATFVEELDILLASAGLPTLVCPAGTKGTSETQHLEQLQGMRVAGVISVSGTPADRYADNHDYRRLHEAGVPAVFMNGFAEGLPGAFFSCSDADSIGQAVAHLRSLGHDRIGLATGPDRYVPSHRKIQAFLALGFGDDDVATTIFTAEGGQAAGATLLDSGHTAIVCGSDIMALGVIREARSRSLAVPGDVSVVGFDDSPLMAFTDPPLTTIRQPVRAMCEAAVSALRAALAGDPHDGVEMLFHPDLIIRRSTAPRR